VSEARRTSHRQQVVFLGRLSFREKACVLHFLNAVRIICPCLRLPIGGISPSSVTTKFSTLSSYLCVAAMQGADPYGCTCSLWISVWFGSEVGLLISTRAGGVARESTLASSAADRICMQFTRTMKSPSARPAIAAGLPGRMAEMRKPYVLGRYSFLLTCKLLLI